MAEKAQYEELARSFSAIGVVKRDLGRMLPPDCPGGSAGVLTLLGRHGDMRMSRLAELLSVDMSVTSRHVAHAAERGWIERLPDPADRRSRILRLTPVGRDRLDDLYERITHLLADRLGDWSDDEVGLLIGLLARLRESFGDCRAGPRIPVAEASPPVAEASPPVAEALAPVAEENTTEHTTRTPA
ncbi:MarR family winged helix-turn-helix transcriptional regulator [Streptomyces bluensis]|uniref:MarR family winged helix-turn-helix transcriptional regulator n=1 Tax=Streptomyces bluensis TaxID=33897 RepID=UPI00367FC579